MDVTSYDKMVVARKKKGSESMGVDVKVNITVNSSNLSASVVMGPAEKPQTPAEEALRKLVWPYNYSNDGALLPKYSSSRELSVTTT